MSMGFYWNKYMGKKAMPDNNYDLFPEYNKITIVEKKQVNTNIITFGKKYLGQPVGVLANDPQYCQWLLTKSWFKDNHPSIYQIIINNFCVPNDTPEHNALQKCFLDNNFCLALGNLCKWKLIRKANCIRNLDMAIRKTQNKFHDNYHVYYKNFEALKSQRDIMGEIFEENGIEYFDFDIPVFYIKQEFEHEGWDVIIQSDDTICQTDCLAYSECYIKSNKIAVEIKPVIGDDYPAILRQMKMARIHPDFQCLVYEKFCALGATIDEVKSIFALSGFKVFSFAEIKNAQKEILISN